MAATSEVKQPLRARIDSREANWQLTQCVRSRKGNNHVERSTLKIGSRRETWRGAYQDYGRAFPSHRGAA